MTKRSSFNVSLQRKHNKVVLGPLIERSEQEGSVISDIIVEYVEKALDYERVVGLNKVMQTYKLIQNMVSAQHGYGTDEFNRRIEDVLKRVIRIDGAELSLFLSDPYGYTGGDDVAPLSTIPTFDSQSRPARDSATPPSPVRQELSSSVATATREILPVQEEEEDEEDRLRRERAEARKKKKAEQQALLRQQEEREEEDPVEDFDIGSLNTGALFND